MKYLLLTLVAVCALASDDKKVISVKEIPPEAIPVGTCTDSRSGWVGIQKDGKDVTKITDKQLGEYVRVRLSQGYSVALYPQVSGRIYSFAQCESAKVVQ